MNPLRSVPALRDGEAEVYEIGACLLYLAERFPEADSRRRSAIPRAPRTCAGSSGWPIPSGRCGSGSWRRSSSRPSRSPACGPRASTISSAWAPIWKRSSRAGRGASGSATASPTSTSTCSSAGSTTSRDCWSGATPSRRISRGSARARHRQGARARRPRRAAAAPPPRVARRQARGCPEGRLRGELRGAPLLLATPGATTGREPR